MTSVYDDKEYIEESAVSLAEAFDYAANSCQMDLDVFMEMFMVSGYARRFEEADASVVLGLSGTELVRKTIEKSGLYLNFPPAARDFSVPSLEYWTGYFFVYLSLYSKKSFRTILENITITEFSDYVMKLLSEDEADREETLKNLLSYVEKPVNLQEIRKECGFSQRELADRSGVNLRTLQQYEVRAKDINRAAAATLFSLARVCGCRIEDIMEN